jgi:hypothetical protein
VTVPTEVMKEGTGNEIVSRSAVRTLAFAEFDARAKIPAAIAAHLKFLNLTS